MASLGNIFKKSASTVSRAAFPKISAIAGTIDALRKKPKAASTSSSSPFTVLSGATPTAKTTYSLPPVTPQVGTTSSGGSFGSKASPTAAAASSGLPSNQFNLGSSPSTMSTRSGWGVGGSGGKPTTSLSGTPTSKGTEFDAAAFLMAEDQKRQSGDTAGAIADSKAYTGSGTVKSQLMPGNQTSTPASTTASYTPPQANAVIDALRSKITGLSAPGAEEQKLTDELAQLRGDAELGISNLEGQGRGIPLSLVRGQQAKLGEQAAIKEGTLMDRISALSAQRQNELLSAQNEYSMAAAEQSRQDALTAPTQVGNQILQFDPATGQYKTLYSAPGEAATPTANIQEYEYARQNGYTGSFVDYQNSQGATSGGGDGFSLSPGQTRYDAFGNVIAAAPEGSDTNMTATESRNQGFFNRAQAAEADIQAALPKVGNLAQGLLPNVVQGSDYQQYEQAAKAWIASILRQESGAAIPPDEMRSYMKIYFPQVGDSDATIQQKSRSRTEAMNALNVSDNSQATQTPSGWDDDEWQYYLQSGGNPSVFTNAVSSALNSSSLGSLSEKYESGGNPGAIGYDNTGGLSYGTYQLAHNNAQRFVEQSPYKSVFAGLKFNSKEWQNKWKEIAQKAPQQFAAAQKDYIAKTHFQPQVEKLKKAGINVTNLPSVVQDAIWSTAVQHGANTDVIAKAFSKLSKTASAADVLKAIYNERWSGGARFASSTPQVKQSVFNRFFGKNGELATALSRLQSNVG